MPENGPRTGDRLRGNCDNMLKWSEKLYMDDSVRPRQEDIRKKLDQGQCVPGIYLITLSANPSDLMDLVPELMLQQDRIRSSLPTIIGLAMGKPNAIRLACDIIQEGCLTSQNTSIRSWLLQRNDWNE